MYGLRTVVFLGWVAIATNSFGQSVKPDAGPTLEARGVQPDGGGSAKALTLSYPLVLTKVPPQADNSAP